MDDHALIAMFNKYREVFSSGEAFLSWNQSEENAPYNKPVSSDLSVMTRSYIGSYLNIN